MSDHYKHVPLSEEAQRGDSDGFGENRSEYAVKWPEQRVQDKGAQRNPKSVSREYANDSADDVSSFRPTPLAE